MKNIKEEVEDIFRKTPDFWDRVHRYNEIARNLTHFGAGTVDDLKKRRAYAAEFRRLLGYDAGTFGYIIYVEEHGTEKDKAEARKHPKRTYLDVRNRVQNKSQAPSAPTTVVEKAIPYPLSEILVNIDYISEITEQFFTGWRDDIALMETFGREKIVDRLDDLIGQLYRLRGEVKHGTCVERNQKN